MLCVRGQETTAIVMLKKMFFCAQQLQMHNYFLYMYIRNKRKLRYNKDILFVYYAVIFYYIMMNVICPHSTLIFINIISRIYHTYMSGVLNLVLLHGPLFRISLFVRVAYD